MTLRRTITATVLGATVFEGGGLVLEKYMAPGTPVDVNLKNQKVSIHCSTLNEGPWIEETLETIVNQPLYQKTNIKLVILDSYSTDDTREKAKKYTSEVWLVPRGKLTARDQGLRKDDADIVVSVDSGDLYPPGWLSRLLKPYEKPSVIATHGPILSRDWLWKAPHAWFNLVRPRFQGISARNSSMKPEAYKHIGGWNLDIDQLSREKMVLEEERTFLNRLRQAGEVAYNLSAGIYASQRHQFFTFENGRVPAYTLERETGIRF